jgi:pyruvate kinase
MRIGRLSSVVILQRGDIVTFRNGSNQISKEIPLPHETVFEIVEKGDLLLLNDGRIELSVLAQGQDSFTAEVVAPGELSSFKGFVMQKCSPELVKISPRDQAFIEQTQQWKFVGYAISYIQNAKELRLFRNIANGRSIVAKIERKEAFGSLKEIADGADMLWLCRGDLGVDGSIFDLFSYEKKFIDAMALMSKPALVAGQILENMVNKASPSRSEVAHLGFLMENGFSGLVLSDETAIGKFPVEALKFCSDYLKYMAC